MWYKILGAILATIVGFLVITQAVIAISPYISLIVILLGVIYYANKYLDNDDE